MKRVRLAVGIVVGLLAFAAAVDVVSSAPALCGSCHEMGPRTEAWKQSAHSEVKCVKCHQSPREWWQAPAALVARGGLLGKDVTKHIAGGYEDPVETRPAGVEPMRDEVCLQCHDPNRKATSGFRILIDHPEHAKRNKSCVSCHVRTAHPLPTRGKALSLMSQCFTCHGTAEQPKASAKCGLCHPSDFDLKPASHTPSKWKRGHAKVALTDRKQCSMCHEQKFCTNCHGLEMPHPKDWAKGTKGHATYGKVQRAKCEKCHTQKPDLCSMCHHKAFDPMKGAWVNQHFIQARSEGTAFCFRCHGPLFCSSCHVRWASSNGDAASL